uniref:Uncharacterized protein n=1 Tax=Nelumbo nucifera TaxID=4432 RepID=A0A822Z8Z3_NELNU|nr:TPA_asm: hypothetical protein HUJ06_014142 [Nelumbo nucifera]
MSYLKLIPITCRCFSDLNSMCRFVIVESSVGHSTINILPSRRPSGGQSRITIHMHQKSKWCRGGRQAFY